MDLPVTDAAPELPALEPGVTLLTTDDRATGPLQSLVLDHLLVADCEAVWVDAGGHAATTSLARLAPSRRTLERVRVARAFTAFQHHALLADLPEELREATGLVVVPAVDRLYAADDLRSGEGEAMLSVGLDRLDAVASDRDLPVLVTRASVDGPGERVAERCDRLLECTSTRFGPRFSGEEFETLRYDVEGGVQTTLAFWRRLLERRYAAATGGVGGVRGGADDGESVREVTPVGSH